MHSQSKVHMPSVAYKYSETQISRVLMGEHYFQNVGCAEERHWKYCTQSDLMDGASFQMYH
jgi:hypothetical protein